MSIRSLSTVQTDRRSRCTPLVAMLAVLGSLGVTACGGRPAAPSVAVPDLTAAPALGTSPRANGSQNYPDSFVSDKMGGNVIVRVGQMGSELRAESLDSFGSSSTAIAVRDIVLNQGGADTVDLSSVNRIVFPGAPLSEGGPALAVSVQEETLQKLLPHAQAGNLYVVGDYSVGYTSIVFRIGLVLLDGRVAQVISLPLNGEDLPQYLLLAEKAGLPPDLSLARAWNEEQVGRKSSQTRGRLAQLALDLFRPTVAAPGPRLWESVDPKVRGLDNPMLLPPVELQARLQPRYLQFSMVPQFVGSSQSGAVILRSKTGVVKNVWLGAGSITTVGMIVPGEDIEVVHLIDGIGPDGPVVGLVAWSELAFAARILIEVGGAEAHPTFATSACGAAASRTCPPDGAGFPETVPVVAPG